MNNILPISVLIPTMNRPDSLERTLKKYMNSKFIPSQIVVIDQSVEKVVADRNKKVLESIANEIDFIYIYQKEPSLTKARNNAIKEAVNDIVICSDDDIDVYEDTLINAYSVMSDSNVVMISGLDDNMPLSETKMGYLLGFKSFKNRHIGHVTNSLLGRFPDRIDNETDTMWAMGFFFVIRKSLVNKWNLQWDEKLTGYAYAEDLDFSYSYYKKAKIENLKCIMTNRVRVKHLASQEFRTPSRKYMFMYVLNRYYLSNKHQMGLKSLISMKISNYIMIIFQKLKSGNPKDLKDAINYLKHHKEEIKKGKFIYDE
ncbi:hypothetical protein IMSAGC017_00447 [Thomasclavelia cocleata]|uniref:Glycosyltransferase 2-like domain-containing protein n=1 Tax=Thomasclavelia cocleata TaxID=69824 RepID=A0A829Z8W0_9FIRM|nr:glycosyltransferase [Thomasclavelia cocleata]GFI40415.1 hypothetical protein IMSAGC017_00447 [Thomasclavelia cocleata]